MDIPYAVKQIDLEIKYLEETLREKKDARGKLFGTLSPQQKSVVDQHKSDLFAPPKKG